mmetsp:Transcript_38511/g.92011  ORF Transcript_38511/g.92011 Transcript_38511/m.92011 type:complete len:285 (+) Transcript_38511:949-1803(+)
MTTCSTVTKAWRTRIVAGRPIRRTGAAATSTRAASNSSTVTSALKTGKRPGTQRKRNGAGTTSRRATASSTTATISWRTSPKLGPRRRRCGAVQMNTSAAERPMTVRPALSSGRSCGRPRRSISAATPKEKLATTVQLASPIGRGAGLLPRRPTAATKSIRPAAATAAWKLTRCPNGPMRSGSTAAATTTSLVTTATATCRLSMQPKRRGAVRTRAVASIARRRRPRRARMLDSMRTIQTIATRRSALGQWRRKPFAASTSTVAVPGSPTAVMSTPTFGSMPGP